MHLLFYCQNFFPIDLLEDQVAIQMEKKMLGCDLIDRDERAAVLVVFDSSEGVPFAHGFDKYRTGRYSVSEFEQHFSKKIRANYSFAVSSSIFRL
jgi:hypothetical protein